MLNNSTIKSIINDSIKAKSLLLDDQNIINMIDQISNVIYNCFLNEGKLMIAGNGGSAGDSQHVAAEFTGRFEKERKPLPAIALTTDTSALTAISNDYAFENIFSRQIIGLAKNNDIFLGLTTSGKSKNILNALSESKKRGVLTVSLCGSYSKELEKFSDYIISVPSNNTARIQECHLLILHIICSLVEKNF